MKFAITHAYAMGASVAAPLTPCSAMPVAMTASADARVQKAANGAFALPARPWGMLPPRDWSDV